MSSPCKVTSKLLYSGKKYPYPSDKKDTKRLAARNKLSKMLLIVLFVVVTFNAMQYKRVITLL